MSMHLHNFQFIPLYSEEIQDMVLVVKDLPGLALWHNTGSVLDRGHEKNVHPALLVHLSGPFGA